MKYDLIIFDMDGTLVQSEDCASQALIDVIPALKNEDCKSVTERYRGMRLARIFDDIESRIPGAIPEGCLELYREREDVLSVSMITESEGAREMLEQLSTNKCIASNAPVEKTRRSLDICRLGHFFPSEVYSAYQVDAWKPDPRLFRFAARAFSVEPEKCLVVEDSEVGLEAARAAGMDSVFYDPHELGKQSADQKKITALVNVLEMIR